MLHICCHSDLATLSLYSKYRLFSSQFHTQSLLEEIPADTVYCMAQDCQAFSRQEKSGRVKLGGREEWPAGWGGVEGRSDRAGDWPCRSDEPGHTRLLHTADTGRLLVCRVFVQRFLLIQKCKNVRKLFLYKKQFGLFMEMFDFEII